MSPPQIIIMDASKWSSATAKSTKGPDPSCPAVPRDLHADWAWCRSCWPGMSRLGRPVRRK
jgi:hypothetical protein